MNHFIKTFYVLWNATIVSLLIRKLRWSTIEFCVKQIKLFTETFRLSNKYTWILYYPILYTSLESVKSTPYCKPSECDSKSDHSKSAFCRMSVESCECRILRNFTKFYRYGQCIALKELLHTTARQERYCNLWPLNILSIRSTTSIILVENFVLLSDN